MPEPIRLFILDIQWPPETFLRRKLDWLTRAGVQITVCSTFPRRQVLNEQLDFLQLHSSATRALPAAALTLVGQSLRHPGKVMQAWRSARAAGQSPVASLRLLLRYAALFGQQPDIIHFEWNSDAVRFLPLLPVLGCPFTVSCRGRQVNIVPHTPTGEKNLAGLHASFRQAAAVHCVSEAIMREAQQFSLDSAKAWVIRPSVDPDIFKPPATPPQRNPGEPLQIITTGSVIWRKGYEYALMSVKHLADRGIEAHLEIIGGGEDRQRVLYTAHDLGIEDRIHLTGRIPPEEVLRRLQTADVFILASLSEGISNAVLEAMSCGLPVVTTDCGGMREAVTDGVEGFVVPVRDAVAMADKLEQLAASPDLRAKMGTSGRARIIEGFTLEKQRDQFIEMYRAVAAGSVRTKAERPVSRAG